MTLSVLLRMTSVALRSLQHPIWSESFILRKNYANFTVDSKVFTSYFAKKKFPLEEK